MVCQILTVRSGLWEVLEDISGWVDDDLRRIQNDTEWRCFVLGYAAACLIVRLDRVLLERVATDTVTQRKLNEGSRERRIPRKRYTAVFESFTDPMQAARMEAAMRFVRRHRRRLRAMANDRIVGSVASDLEALEEALDPSRRRYLRRLFSFIIHAFRRRGASVQQQTVFAALEAGGRLMSELRDQWGPDRVGGEIRRRIADLLRPGDVIVARHDRAVTNLFLPGFWPHAALYVGAKADRRRLGVAVDTERAVRWSGDRNVLEALKDGVLYRPLDETLAVDAVAVIRPLVDDAFVAQALMRAAVHEGKLYNFDFDFFRSDRLVCTEVVYRAYDGVGPIKIHSENAPAGRRCRPRTCSIWQWTGKGSNPSPSSVPPPAPTGSWWGRMPAPPSATATAPSRLRSGPFTRDCSHQSNIRLTAKTQRPHSNADANTTQSGITRRPLRLCFFALNPSVVCLWGIRSWPWRNRKNVVARSKRMVDRGGWTR